LAGEAVAAGLVGQTIGFRRLSIPRCALGLTGSKKHRPAITTDDDRRQETIVCPTLGGSLS